MKNNSTPLKYLRILASTALMVGCSSTPEIPPDELALGASQDVIQSGLIAGDEESNQQDLYTVTARYNPSRCDCPPFEIFAYGRWLRVYFEGSIRETRVIEDFARKSQEGSAGKYLRLRGRLTQESQRSKRNTIHPVFELQDPQ